MLWVVGTAWRYGRGSWMVSASRLRRATTSSTGAASSTAATSGSASATTSSAGAARAAAAALAWASFQAAMCSALAAATSGV